MGDATDSQYVLATVNGDYGGPFEFSRGGFGKYTGGFATHMGLCFPKQCTMDEVEGYTKELIKGYAEGIGWNNVVISYYAASDHDALQTVYTDEKTSTGIVVLAGIMGLALIAVMVGSCIEASTFGDKEEVSNAVDADALHQAAQFRRLEQYDAVLLQRKSDRARTALPFSMLRNGVHLNLPQRSLRTAIENEKKDTAIRKDRRIAQYLKVFNGMRGSAMLLMIWAFTFYFVSFSVISNRDQMEQMQKTLLFNIVSCTVYTVPTFFFCSGFLQTFAFMQKDQEMDMFTAQNLGRYYARKVLRYVPLNVVAMLIVTKALPYLGSGPVWNFYDKLVAPCQTNWWTNVLWVNNLYPAEFDDKCLPWTWFVPCYVQLSLIVPPTLFLYKKVQSKMMSGIILTSITVMSIILTFAFAFSTDYGATIATNNKNNNSEEFFSKVFMNPLFHLSSFFLGICMSLVYVRFRKERGHISALKNSFSSRLIEMLRHNQAPRYFIYMIGIFCIFASILWQTPFMAGSSTTATRVMRALYASLAFPLYLVGVSMILMPALAGKA